ncbi:MAG: alpha/beta hydrolase [Rhizobiaceae bacterium]
MSELNIGTIEDIEMLGSEANCLKGSYFIPSEKSDKPPVLFMHGGGQTRHSWKGAASMMAHHGYPSFTFDARGHGDSDWIANKHYSIQYFRDDLRALTTQLTAKIQRPMIVIGASLGGISAMLAQAEGGSETNTALFQAIVLVDITPRMTSSGVDKILGFMGQNMRDGFATVEDAADVIASYLPTRTRPKSLEGLSKNLRKRADGRWYWHWDPAFVDGSNSISKGGEGHVEVLIDAVKKIDVPTLLVRGGKSELVTKEAANEFLELVPHAQFVDVSEAGHMVAGDKNDVFASAVLKFLQSQDKV